MSIETTKATAIAEIDQHIKYLELWIKSSNERVRMWTERKQSFEDRLAFAKDAKAKLEQVTSLDEIETLLTEIVAKQTNFQIEEKQS